MMTSTTAVRPATPCFASQASIPLSERVKQAAPAVSQKFVLELKPDAVLRAALDNPALPRAEKIAQARARMTRFLERLQGSLDRIPQLSNVRIEESVWINETVLVSASRREIEQLAKVGELQSEVARIDLPRPLREDP